MCNCCNYGNVLCFHAHYYKIIIIFVGDYGMCGFIQISKVMAWNYYINRIRVLKLFESQFPFLFLFLFDYQ